MLRLTRVIANWTRGTRGSPARSKLYLTLSDGRRITIVIGRHEENDAHMSENRVAVAIEAPEDVRIERAEIVDGDDRRDAIT